MAFTELDTPLPVAATDIEAGTIARVAGRDSTDWPYEAATPEEFVLCDGDGAIIKGGIRQE